MFEPPVSNGKNRPTTLASSQFGGSGKTKKDYFLFLTFKKKKIINSIYFVFLTFYSFDSQINEKHYSYAFDSLD